MQNSEVTKIVKKAISHSGVVLFDMMNQHTENINDFLRTAFNKCAHTVGHTHMYNLCSISISELSCLESLKE